MASPPPLKCLRFFEAAARRENFAKAAGELHVTPSAVAHRVKALEAHIGGALFERGHRGVRLNGRGKAYLKDVQRILADLSVVTERRRGDSGTRRLKLVSIESVAEKWLMPRLSGFKASHPGVVIELETNHRRVDPARRDFDAWIAYVGETAAPRPEGLYEETVYEEELFPVCSPALIEERGRPADALDLHDWPLLYDLGWDTDWPYWFSRQVGKPSPDLSRASGFRLYSMVVAAAAEGIGAAMGHSQLIAGELERGELVSLLERQAAAPVRCCLITTADSRRDPGVRAFREWILEQQPEGPWNATCKGRYLHKLYYCSGLKFRVSQGVSGTITLKGDQTPVICDANPGNSSDCESKSEDCRPPT